MYIIGLLVMIISVSSITIDAASDTNALIAILCGFFGALVMSKRHVFPANYSGFDMGLDSCILEFFAYQFLLNPLYYNDSMIGLEESAIGTVAGLLIATGRIAIAEAVSIGFDGPA